MQWRVMPISRIFRLASSDVYHPEKIDYVRTSFSLKSVLKLYFEFLALVWLLMLLPIPVSVHFRSPCQAFAGFRFRFTCTTGTFLPWFASVCSVASVLFQYHDIYEVFSHLVKSG